MPSRDFRAARAQLRLGLNELANLSGVSVPTLQRLEDDDCVRQARESTIAKVRQALIDAGATFGDDGTYVEPSTEAGAPADPFMISSRRFKRARIVSELSFAQLSELTGLTRQTLRTVEQNGHARPKVSRETLRRVVKAYRTVGFCLCVDPAFDHLDRTAWEEWRNAA